LTPFRRLGKLFLIALLTQGASLSARSAVAVPVTEQELAAKLRFYAKIGTLETDFHQVKVLKELGMEMKSEGRLTLKRPDSVVWEVTKPAPVKVELGRAGVRITNGEGASARVENFPTAEMPKEGSASSLHDLVAWLRLDAHALSTQYAIAKTAPDHFIFTPKKPGPFRTMEMDLSQDGHLKKLVLNEATGDQMRLTFAKPRVMRATDKDA
jgi:hypothetical protein